MTTLYSKIASVSKAVGSLETDKTNQQQRYDYISADKILSVVGAKMAEHGLVIVPTVISQMVNEATSSTGKKFFDAEISFVMIIGDGGEQTIEALWIGRGSDYAVPDKAIYKAITSGHKYFLMKLFNIGVGNEDGEHETPQASISKSSRIDGLPIVDASIGDYAAGDEVMVRGQHDEKPGIVTGVNGAVVTVNVNGKEIKVKPERLTLIEVEPVQDDMFGNEPDATYQE